MFKRLMIASAGAVVVTIALLLMMNRAANHLAIQDPVQYFGISDFIPYTGTRRPPPLPVLDPRPELPPLETEDTRRTVPAPFERPEITLPAMDLPPAGPESSGPLSQQPGSQPAGSSDSEQPIPAGPASQ